MGTFKYHTSCESCGSRDNLAVYSEGSAYCFGCGFYRSGTLSPYLDEIKPSVAVLSLPDDASREYGQEAIVWTSKYGLSTSELLQHNAMWSEQKKQLIFTFKDDDGDLLLWQARNFGAWAKTRYFTRGVPDEVLPIYSSSTDRKAPLVLVEDCVSAIKIARQAFSMPVLGSDLSKAKLTRLAAFWGASSPIVIWLDGNMFHKAQRIAGRLCFLGCSASVRYSEHDPKEYSDEDIAKVLDFS